MNKPTGFRYSKTKSLIKFHWKDGKWDVGELLQEDRFSLEYSATVLHYGQSAFEGMKAFKWEDGNTRVFRPFENAKRLRRSCSRLMMPEVSDEMFLEALTRVIKDNNDYIPGVDEAGSLYIRPFVFGCGPTIGVRPSDEYQFVVMVMPVGDYYSSTAKPTGLDAVVYDEFDRAAPGGLGNVKAAGNYSADLYPTKKAKDAGFDIVLYLDASTHSYVEEFGTSNFVAISKEGAYVTPDSNTILKSITNLSLQDLAKSQGRKVECRKVAFSELKDFTHIGACGTAVVCSPLESITRHNEVAWQAGSQGNNILLDLVGDFKKIQKGQVKDSFNWMYALPE